MRTVIKSIASKVGLVAAILFLTPIPPDRVDLYTPSLTYWWLAIMSFAVYIVFGPGESKTGKAISFCLFGAAAFVVVWATNSIPW